jgi:glyceraldehyde 3-phosphate dehydrogenase
MVLKVAINGFGRIGRNILRALYESNKRENIIVVAINDMGDVKTSAHLLKYDTTHGKFSENISSTENTIIVNGDTITVCNERDPSKLPWKQLNVDVVYECTGLFTSKAKASAHIQAGAKKVIISAPGDKDIDATIVYGVNHHILNSTQQIISNASCTTNCLAPLAKILHEKVGIENGLMTTIHAYTNDQVLVDSAHSDLRRARSATHSMIPTKTGAASAIGLVLPELNGKLDGFAMRVPVLNVSIVDLTFTAKREVTVEKVNQMIKDAAENEMYGIIAYSDEPLVSIDFNHHTASSIYDATQTKISGSLVKVLSWYDNEWGFSNRMLDTTLAWMSAK